MDSGARDLLAGAAAAAWLMQPGQISSEDIERALGILMSTLDVEGEGAYQVDPQHATELETQ